MKSKYFVIALLATLGFLTAVVASTSAATFINNLTAGGAAPNSPINLDPGWLFWVQSDTVSGDAICVEVHPQGDAGNYVRAQCSYDNVNGPINSNWRCEVFTGGVPSAFQSKTIEYQFHTANYGSNCQTNTYLFTGFNWTFATRPHGRFPPILHRPQPDAYSAHPGCPAHAGIGGRNGRLPTQNKQQITVNT